VERLEPLLLMQVLLVSIMEMEMMLLLFLLALLSCHQTYEKVVS
jgi:hypothetical protein